MNGSAFRMGPKWTGARGRRPNNSMRRKDLSLNHAVSDCTGGEGENCYNFHFYWTHNTHTHTHTANFVNCVNWATIIWTRRRQWVLREIENDIGVAVFHLLHRGRFLISIFVRPSLLLLIQFKCHILRSAGVVYSAPLLFISFMSRVHFIACACFCMYTRHIKRNRRHVSGE